MSKRKVLIVGGGFGGIKVALKLSENDAFDTKLISDRPNFRYYPKLYRTATGGSREVSEMFLTEILKDKPVEVVIDGAYKLNHKEKELHLKSGQKLKFDILILALGSETNYFGIKGLKDYSYGIKSISEAERLKKHLHQQLSEDKHPDHNYVIVGGGPTGVELAAALTAYLRDIMKRHGMRKAKPNIELVEAAPRLVPKMTKDVSKALAKRLGRLGVKLRLNTTIQAETANTLLLNGQYIRTHTVIWTAGVANNRFFELNDFETAPNGKVRVDKLLQAWPAIYVIGDSAETPYSGMAQTALYDADFVAENLIRHVDNQPPFAYQPKRPIYIIPAGKHWAAVAWGSFRIYGRLGWLLRRAADWLGYKDFGPWWQATEQLLADDDSEEDCVVCMSKEAN